MKIRYYLFFTFVFIYSCRPTDATIIKKECDQFGCIDIYKYLPLSTAPFSITEDAFWFRGAIDHEHAKLTMHDVFNEGLIEAIRSKKRVSMEEGLVDNFDYAFIIRKDKDTIYASLTRNLWTIKKDGEFEYFKDKEEELKIAFQQYSGFFSNCW